MLKLRNVKLVAALTAAVLGLSLSGPTNAGIQEKMNKIFGDMSNTTSPGQFNTQRRGVLSGGSMIVRSPVVDTTLINIELPHATGGCGGMDMFAGSISFINADQFIALLRAIAANAKGYAFQIAMNAASSLISSKLGEFQKVIQALNSMNLNSCELAKGIINLGLDEMGKSNVVKKYGVEANLSGFGDITDVFQHASNSKNYAQEVKEKSKNDPALAKKIDLLSGNMIWKALKNGNFKDGLGSESEGNEFGALMAITGTVVISDPKTDQSSAQESDVDFKEYPPILKAEDFINGGTVPVYECNDDGCMNPVKTKKKIKGLKEIILNAIKGNGTTTGLIAKYRMDSTAFSEDEQKIAKSLPADAGFVLRMYSTRAPAAAYQRADDLAGAIAMEFAFDMSRDYLQLAMYALSTSTMAKKDYLMQRFADQYNAISNELTSYAQNHKTITQIVSDYNQAIKNTEAIKMTAQQYTPKDTGATKSDN